MNTVEEQVAERVALLYPDVFAKLAGFAVDHKTPVDDPVARFDRDVQFYLAAAELCRRFEAAGLPTCYPTVNAGRTATLADNNADDNGADDRVDGVDPATLTVRDGYDAALAAQTIQGGGRVVTNDVLMTNEHRLLVVTGPNQGGKTTYARMVGQLSYVAALGVRVPARECTLELPDRMLTHFERGENLTDLTGKLDDDLIRVRDLLRDVTGASVVILNEIFTSTSAADALWLGARILRQLTAIGCRGVCVTFLDELTEASDATVSLVAGVDPDDPAARTFTVTERPADGRAYADAVAARYGLTPAALARRLP